MRHRRGRMDRKTKRKDWFNDKCRELITKRTKLRYKTIQNNSEENRKEYEQGRKETHTILRREKRQYMKELIATVEENRKSPRQFFESSGRIKQGFKPQTNIMLNDNKELVTD